MKTSLSIQDIRDNVEFLQSLTPDNEVYCGILDDLQDNTIPEHILQDMSRNPAIYFSYSTLVELHDLHNSRPFYLDVEGTSIKIDGNFL